MLYADISTPIQIRCNFPLENPLAVEQYLADFGIEGPLSKIKLTDYETDATRIRISGDTEVDAHLAKLFTREISLHDVNVVARVMENLDDRIKGEIEKDIVNDTYSTLGELRRDIRHQMYELGSVSETFYFPIGGYLSWDKEEHWVETADKDCLLESEVGIGTYLRYYVADNGIYMHEYYDGPGSEKLTFAEWGVEGREGTLYGTVSARLTEPFSEEETEAFKDWILHQNAECFGVDFRKEGIFTDHGFLHIYLWPDPDDYFVFDHAEMHGYLNQRDEMLADTYDSFTFEYPDANEYLYQFGGM